MSTRSPLCIMQLCVLPLAESFSWPVCSPHCAALGQSVRETPPGRTSMAFASLFSRGGQH